MIRVLLFPFFLISSIITKNVTKTVFLTIALVTLYFSYNVDREMITTEKVYTKFIDSESNINYVVSKDNINFSVKHFEKPLKITNNSITYKHMSDSRAILLVIFSIASIILVIGFFAGLSDSEISWEFRDCWLIALSTLIVCELEDNHYHYIILGRLVYKSDKLVEKYSSQTLIEKFNIYGFKDIMNYPNFKTKTQSRNNKLNKLGI